MMKVVVMMMVIVAKYNRRKGQLGDFNGVV